MSEQVAGSAAHVSDGEPAAVPASVERSPERILVADADAAMRELLVRLLGPHWEVEAVGDGRAALAAALARPPALVLSDVTMPPTDGVSLLRALRSEDATRSIPVVLLAARAGEEAVLEGLETDADDYLVKPFSTRELLSRVRTHLAMARLRREAAESARLLADTRARLLKDLQRKSNELEAFCYSVSHDLRAPLRTIDGFSLALLEDNAAQLDAAGQGHLQRVRAAAQRMAELIDDLLTLSRVERSELRREEVDLSHIAGLVAETLQKANPDRRVEVSIEPGMVTQADPRLVQVVFEHLLGNAWKFTAKAASARIEVGASRRDDERTFFVRDDGAGFDLAFATKLFGPFQRFHAQADFPGTGIGLATVQRIVHRHGGEVWAEAAVGKGATIHWTLPDAAPL